MTTVRDTRFLWFVSTVAFVNVIALGVLGVLSNHALDRTHVNTARIERDAYEVCQVRNRNVERLNILYRGLAEIERDNPYQSTSPETIQRRVDLYRSALQNAADCGPNPGER